MCAARPAIVNESYRTANGTLYEIDDEFGHVQTIFADGNANTGVPEYDVEGMLRARELGYEGADDEVVWAMNRHHDLLHSLVCEAAGFAMSPSLRYSIDGPPAKGVIPMEERVVFFVQRLLVRLIRAGVSERDALELMGARLISEHPAK